MDDSDKESIASTIQSEHGSDQEWNVIGILAAWEVDSCTRYLILWEGYPLFDATWEPRDNLNDGLIEEWEETRTQQGFDMFQNIRDWKDAYKTQYFEKLDRHQTRNRLRKQRGLRQTTWNSYREKQLEWINQFPDSDPSGSTVSSPSVITDNDTDVGAGELPQYPFPKGKLSTASLSEDNSPSSSRRNNVVSTHKQTLAQIGSTAPSTGQKQAPTRQSSNASIEKKRPQQKSASTSSLLSSKFGHRAPLKRTGTQIRKGQLTARKTQHSQAFTGNVFSGGTVRKKRATLAEAAKDPTKQPKLMRHRYARIIEKAGRDREGAAPARLPSDLISLNPAERHMGSLNVSDPEVADTTGIRSLNDGDKLAQHDENSPEANQEASTPKLKKSISWGAVQETIIPATEEPMEFEREPSLFLRSESLPRAVSPLKTDEGSPDAETPTESSPELSIHTKTSSKHVRWTENAPTINDGVCPSSQRVITDVQFGPGNRETISVVFERRQPQNEQPWPDLFGEEPTLIFTHTCLAQDFWSSESNLAAVKLATGSVTGNGDPTSLATVANWLCMRSLGVLLYHRDVCIFLHMSPQMQPQTRPAADVLQYYLFLPTPHFTTRSLAPIVLPEGIDSGDVLPHIVATVFNRMLGFHYEQLLPEAAPLTPSKHNFFLAFPPSAYQDAEFIAAWLRYCNPECRILSSFFPGHWRSFLKLEQGVVIVHEEAIWALRLFPGVRIPLHSASGFSFRLFSKSVQPLPLYPSLGQPCRTGDVTLQPLCGQRKAIMVTPSFVVSEPQQVWRLIKWFSKYQGERHDSVRLVVCADFETWLLRVATDIEDWAIHSRRTRVRQEEREAALKDLEALFKSWALIRTLLAPSNEEQTAFVFAPQSIDGNDEQSLVNWFGWWSIMNLDEYRKFFVVGSHGDADAQSLSRYITVPEYTTPTFASPDDIYGIDRADSSRAVSQEEHSAACGPAMDQPQKKLRSIPGDDAASFAAFLQKLEQNVRGSEWSPQTIFHFPVAHWDADMACAFSGHSSEFASYSKCLHYFKEKVHGPSWLNTGVALCYTIEGNWSPGGNPGNTNKNRRPWIVAYRPIEMFKKPWDGMELIIWDPIKRIQDGEAEIYEGDLIEAQRQMIRAVRNGLDHLLPLRRVWIGGHSTPQGLLHPIDITIYQLQGFMEDLKMTIPAPTHSMMARGWKVVQRGHAPRMARQPSPEPMDIDAITDMELKTVFHPPRGKQLDRPTNCENHLFQHCTNKKTNKGHRRDPIMYTFRPTTVWYKEQVEEGRGFEHIRITDWQSFFEKSKIDDPTLARTGSETNTNPANR
ncbi:hypothetical protein F53441_12052 [Fusarium austroafricanum]|uniref:Chromo domain-containing protein n=1 Tax=Fusarium austroafricanum TaxID=2364996 RepID=A0A8H4NN70_9HYPO|nr:hypothetical protein F53441_12052 [Fusarium austroafricanum]